MTMVTPHARAAAAGQRAHCRRNDLITAVTVHGRRRRPGRHSAGTLLTAGRGVGRPRAAHKNPPGPLPETNRLRTQSELGAGCPHRARPSSVKMAGHARYWRPQCLIGSNHGVFPAQSGAPAAAGDPQRSLNCLTDRGGWERPPASISVRAAVPPRCPLVSLLTDRSTRQRRATTPLRTSDTSLRTPLESL